MLVLEHIAWNLPDGEPILKDITLTVPDGKLAVVTGPNGGGKTSLAKLIAGLEKPAAGRILLDGEDITGLDITQRAKKGVAYAFQQPVRFKGLSVRDLLELAAGNPLSDQELCTILGQVGLCAQDYTDRQVDASLSGGESKRIEIATVLARKDANLLIFDEPEAGIDLWSFSGLIDVFQRIKSRKQDSALIISHQERILQIADEIIVIADGEVRSAGPREQILPTLLGDEKTGRCRWKEVRCMNKITETLLGLVSDWKGVFNGAYNIREDGACAGRQSSEHIQIESKEGAPGLVIHIAPEAQNETVYIPACVTHSDVNDLVYNDFYVGEGAHVTIVAGCGVHSDGEEEARHNGIHRFFVEKGAYVLYQEKHVGTGSGAGIRRIDPVSDIHLAEDAVLEMDTVQIGGVDRTDRKTTAQLADRARLIIHESILTEGEQTARTDFSVSIDGEDASVDLVSRSVAKGNSRQEYHSRILGNNRCTGHSECDAILVGSGKVNAAPELFAGHIDASLIHEAAIGKIAGEQIIKLRTLGLTEEEAEERIIQGFLQG